MPSSDPEVIDMKGLRGLIEIVDAWGDTRGLPCFLVWAQTRLPRFANWFWRGV